MACTQSSLEASAKCFVNLSPNDRDAAIVWYLWQGLQTCASYSSSLTTLLTDAACFANNSPEMLQAMEVVNAAQAASDMGASTTGTLAEAVEGIKCLKNADPEKIQALLMYLRCKVNTCLA